MIFSLLNVRKKTAATIAGIAIAALCLWGISTWQDIPVSELFSILLATTIMVGAVMVAAILLIAIFKILGNFLGKSPDTDNKGKQD